MSGKPTPHPRLQRVYRSEDAAPFEFYGHDPNGQIVALNNPAVLAKYLDRVYLKFLGDPESSKTRNFPMADGEKEYEDMADVETVRRWATDLVRESLDPSRKRSSPWRPLPPIPTEPSPAMLAADRRASEAIERADRFLASCGRRPAPRRGAPPPPPPPVRPSSPRHSLCPAGSDEAQNLTSPEPPGGTGGRGRGGWVRVKPDQGRGSGAGPSGSGSAAPPLSPFESFPGPVLRIDEIIFRVMTVERILTDLAPLVGVPKVQRVLGALSSHTRSIRAYIGELWTLGQDRTVRVLDRTDEGGYRAAMSYVVLTDALGAMEEGLHRALGKSPWEGRTDSYLNSDAELLAAASAMRDSVDAALESFAYFGGVEAREKAEKEAARAKER